MVVWNKSDIFFENLSRLSLLHNRQKLYSLIQYRGLIIYTPPSIFLKYADVNRARHLNQIQNVFAVKTHWFGYDGVNRTLLLEDPIIPVFLQLLYNNLGC